MTADDLARRQVRARGLTRGRPRSRALVDDVWLLRHLRSVAAGESQDAAARRLFVTVDTVKTARRFLYRALRAVNAPQAVALGYYVGLLDPDEDPRVPEPGDPPVERLPDADVLHVWEHRRARAHALRAGQPDPGATPPPLPDLDAIAAGRTRRRDDWTRRRDDPPVRPGEVDPASWRGMPLDEIRRRYPSTATGRPRPEDRTPRD